ERERERDTEAGIGEERREIETTTAFGVHPKDQEVLYKDSRVYNERNELGILHPLAGSQIGSSYLLFL
ncbi:hypothetical protein M8C21_030959, partial [Ambrosia artemisiifolia]